eukprot:55111-Eustigmatos_ZCMA.PRE.2
MKSEYPTTLPAKDHETLVVAGINHRCMLSPPNLLWELASFSVVWQCSICSFHNSAEGHDALLCDDGFDHFSPRMGALLRARWSDENMWSPTVKRVPPFPCDDLSSMTGSDKACVAMHADILLRPFFVAETTEAQIRAYFRVGVRNRLACNLVGEGMGGKEKWKAAQWNAWYRECGSIPWWRFYTDYIVPKARLSRELASMYQTRASVEDGGKLDLLIREYLAGLRLVYGHAYLKDKGICHRALHLPQQMRGELSDCSDNTMHG